MALTVYTFSQNQGFSTHSDLSALKALPDKTNIWIDIETSSAEELATIAHQFGLHELSVEDCLDQGHHPKLENYGRYLFMIFRGLNLPPLDQQDDTDSAEKILVKEDWEYSKLVAIYLSREFLITHRTSEVAWLDAVGRQVQQMPDRTIALGHDSLAHRIIDVLVDRFSRGLRYFEEKIEEFEDKTVQSLDEFELSQTFELKRTLGILRQTMRDQRLVITRLAHETDLIGEAQLRRYFRDIDDHAVATINTIDKQIEMLSGVRDMYFAMSNVRLGDIMRVLAVITTVAAPLNLVVGMYGMNFEAIPLLHDPHGFWLIVIAMVVLTIIMLAFFRKQRWI